jgi:hypothetical protein
MGCFKLRATGKARRARCLAELDGATKIGGELTEGGLGTKVEMRGTVSCRVAALHASPWRADGSLVVDTVAGELGTGTEAQSCTVYLNGGGFLAGS